MVHPSEQFCRSEKCAVKGVVGQELSDRNINDTESNGRGTAPSCFLRKVRATFGRADVIEDGTIGGRKRMVAAWPGIRQGHNKDLTG